MYKNNTWVYGYTTITYHSITYRGNDMNTLELRTDLIKCGFVKMPNGDKWTRQENNFALPNTHAQFINHESKYQYSQVRKLK